MVSIAEDKTYDLGKTLNISINELIELTEKSREKPTNLQISYILTKLYDLQDQLSTGVADVLGYEVDLT